eukprot:9487144-Pyramimonas_sp.AAC.2
MYKYLLIVESRFARRGPGAAARRLGFFACCGSVAAYTYADHGHVDYKAAAVLSLTAMCFAPAGNSFPLRLKSCRTTCLRFRYFNFSSRGFRSTTQCSLLEPHS